MVILQIKHVIGMTFMQKLFFCLIHNPGKTFESEGFPVRHVSRTSHTRSTSDKVQYGLTANTFKIRYADHKRSIRIRGEGTNRTALSIYVWELKDRGLPVSIKWEIAHKATSYQCGSRKCDLCIFEKTAITLAEHESLLNKRSEIVCKGIKKNRK